MPDHSPLLHRAQGEPERPVDLAPRDALHRCSTIHCPRMRITVNGVAIDDVLEGTDGAPVVTFSHPLAARGRAR